ncbi:MAG: DUF4199 domain-containing protein [Caulobacter sp.]|nr:DUF4199 domain-containing protein [Caulobacter sp.]
MFRTILTFGVMAGLIVIVPMGLMMTFGEFGHASHSMITGYAVMLLAFSLVFIGVKRHRDRTLGGVIRFLPALAAGLGISLLASVVYVLGWEITLALTDYAFMTDYAAAVIEAARARGASAGEMAKITTEMDAMKVMYSNPLMRLPMTFVEIFPVGLLVSIVSAALLRNSRFLPLKTALPAQRRSGERGAA